MTKNCPPLSSNACSDNNHAFLAVEGLDSGWLERIFINQVPEHYKRHYFKLFFHFTGDRIEVRFPEKIRITERGEIALVDTEKVQKMLEYVSDEKTKDPPRFSALGRDSWFAGGGENCFTWARTALKIIEIDLGKSFWGFIATGTRAWTKKPKNITAKNEGI
ncbi:MAG: hypothetical protein LLG04_17795 [Parachlamydia sp.]|nr:hypothetical protein [Parachlamydia sp.]